MRLITKIVTLGIIAACLCLPLGLFKPAAAAGTATMYLTPVSASAAKGSTITADVHVNSGSTKIYSVYVALAYPASSLTWLSFTPSSQFTIVPTNKAVGGVAQLDATALAGVTGDNVVATVKFSVTAGSGTAALNFNPVDTSNPLNPNASSVKTATPGQPTYTEVLGTVTGSSYSLSGDPVPTPAPSSTPAPTASSPPASTTVPSSSAAPKKSSSASSSASQPAASTPLSISGVSVSGLGPNSATITWQTSVESNSVVDYGLSTTYIATANDGALVKNHKIELSSLTLLADTAYHFRVKSTDAGNNTVQSEDITFHTPAKSPETSAAKNPNLSALLTTGAIGIIALLGLIIGSKYYSKMRAARRDMEFHFPKLPSGPSTTETKPAPVANSALGSSGSPGTTVVPVAKVTPPAPKAVPAAPKIPAKFQAKPQPKPSSIIKPVAKPANPGPKSAAAKVQTIPTTKVNNIHPRQLIKKLK